MKPITISSFALAVLLAACGKAEAPDTEKGGVRFAVAAEDDVTDVTRSSISDITALPAAENFTLTITDSRGGSVWSGRMGEMTGEYFLDAGAYTAEASFGDTSAEGFDKPCFSGSADFTVTGGETTTVNIPAALGNAIVKVACTDMFAKYFPRRSFRITTAAGTEIDFVQDETRGAFIDPYKFTIEGTLVNQGGTRQSFSKEYSGGISPATCYTVTFDTSSTGGAQITVSFDDSVDTIDLGDIELND